MSHKQKNYAHGGNLSDIEARYKISRQEITDFSANIGPFGLPESIRELLKGTIGEIIHYPDPENRKLKKAISEFFGLDTSNILCGNGSNQLLYLLLACLKPEKALICTPAYSEYQRACEAANAEPVFYAAGASDGFKPDIAELGRQAAGVDFMFICNPNNPTGTLLGGEEMHFILNVCKKEGTFLMVDEAFGDFAAGISLAGLAAEFDNLAVIKSMTKFFSIPGLRLGFVTGGRKLIDKLKLMQPAWSVNRLAQAAGEGFLKEDAYIQKTVDYISREKDRLYGQLKSIPFLEPFYPSANFILVRILKEGEDSGKLFDYCITRHKILIRDCSNFRGLGTDYIRIAVRLKDENNRLVEALRNYFSR
ncbi:MAG: threonine-phosphate decarboxylase CobD [Actinomycetota bacterium]